MAKASEIDQLALDADAMKVLVASSLLIPPDTSGSLSLFSDPHSIHIAISKHLVSERMERAFSVEWCRCELVCALIKTANAEKDSEVG